MRRDRVRLDRRVVARRTPVDDWEFGLVDRQRRLKPAAVAVATAFEDAPFPRDAQRTWPRVSVVVCAYNAADTLDDCLSSLEQLTYPDYEVILVNDGSTRSHERHRTRARARARHRHAERGAERRPQRRAGRGRPARSSPTPTPTRASIATGSRSSSSRFSSRTSWHRADRTWCPPTTRRWRSASRARRAARRTCCSTIASPSTCPAATWRSAATRSLAIGGFNPIYLRAGDDVDVCWRLQARGWKIGFAPAALVWHHHRSSLKAYWRQQVGYGEGETLADGAPPGQVPRRTHAVARADLQPAAVRAIALGHAHQRRASGGRPPFHRSTAPTSIRSRSCRIRSGGRSSPSCSCSPASRWRASGDTGGPRPCCSAPAAIGIAATIAQERHLCAAVRCGLAPRPAVLVPRDGRVSPLPSAARALRGRIRGLLSPPEVALPAARAQTSRGPRPSLGEAWRALLLISGNVAEDRFWSETWTSADRVLGASHRLAAAIARRPDDRGRRRVVRRPRRQRVRRPLGLARHPRAGRGSRRRQGLLRRQHASAAHDLRRRDARSARRSGCSSRPRRGGAAVAAGRRDGGGAGAWR